MPHVMSQLSLLDFDYTRITGLMPSVCAAMRRVAGSADSTGRKLLVDKINAIASDAEVRLTGGRAESISLAVLDKWLSSSDTSHPPSLLAVVIFCRATGNYEPMRVVVQALGLELMTPEDRRYRDYGKADIEMKEARKRKKRLEEVL